MSTLGAPGLGAAVPPTLPAPPASVPLLVPYECSSKHLRAEWRWMESVTRCVLPAGTPNPADPHARHARGPRDLAATAAAARATLAANGCQTVHFVTSTATVDGGGAVADLARHTLRAMGCYTPLSVGPVRLAVLNASHTAACLPDIMSTCAVAYAIGWDGAVSAADGLVFCAHLYRKLSEGLRVEMAHAVAVAAVHSRRQAAAVKAAKAAKAVDPTPEPGGDTRAAMPLLYRHRQATAAATTGDPPASAPVSVCVTPRRTHDSAVVRVPLASPSQALPAGVDAPSLDSSASRSTVAAPGDGPVCRAPSASSRAVHAGRLLGFLARLFRGHMPRARLVQVLAALRRYTIRTVEGLRTRPPPPSRLARSVGKVPGAAPLSPEELGLYTMWYSSSGTAEEPPDAPAGDSGGPGLPSPAAPTPAPPLQPGRVAVGALTVPLASMPSRSVNALSAPAARNELVGVQGDGQPVAVMTVGDAKVQLDVSEDTWQQAWTRRVETVLGVGAGAGAGAGAAAAVCDLGLASTR